MSGTNIILFIHVSTTPCTLGKTYHPRSAPIGCCPYRVCAWQSHGRFWQQISQWPSQFSVPRTSTVSSRLEERKCWKQRTTYNKKKDTYKWYLNINFTNSSLGLSGPGCNSAVVGVATATPPKALRILTQQQLHQVCPVLCQNQLGSELCACEFLPAAENQLWDVDQVCTGFCDAAVNLASCGCRDRLAKIPFTGESVETTGPPDTTDNNIVDITTTTSTTRPTTTTEPDWDSLCVSLCKMGEGGALCNCDKPPFFKWTGCSVSARRRMSQ